MSCVKMKRTFSGRHDDSESKKAKTISNPKQDFINYVSIPTLENMAIIIVTTGLGKQTDIREAIRKHSLEYDPVGDYFSCIRGDEHDDSLNKIEKSILKKISLLPLPDLVKAKMTNIIKPVVLQMLEWIRYDRKDMEYMDTICWTNEGTIDKMKTFQQLFLRNSNQQYINGLYKLACKCCFEEYIHVLWDKLPQERKNFYSRRTYKEYDSHLIAYWTSVVKKELSGLFCKIKQHDHKNIYDINRNVYQNMFKLAVSEGNILAAKHFWNKLTDEEISSNLEQWITDSICSRKKFWTGYQTVNKFSDVLYFFLSQMCSGEQQKIVFKENSQIILTSLFLDWPWQRFLLPTIQKIWTSLDGEVYTRLLCSVFNQIKENKTTEKLLRQLWQSSPVNLKKHFIQFICNDIRKGTEVLCILLAVGDTETLKLLFNYANDDDIKQITLSIFKNQDLYKIIYTDKLASLDILLTETLTSDSDVKSLKTKIILEFGNRLCCSWICDDNWQMVEKFLKWAFFSQDEIDNFKCEVLDKIEVTYRILKQLGNYDLVEKFFSWCFSSENEINQFKKNFPESKHEIVTIGEDDWSAFEKFVSWCLNCDEDVNGFKCSIRKSNQILHIISDNIVYNYNFEFVDKLISWCCHTNEEIKLFKTEFVLSGPWLGILQRFVSNYKVYCSESSNFELTRKLIKLFFPLEKEALIKLKENIAAEIDFDDYRECGPKSVYFDEDELFFLMDDDNYITDDEDDDENSTDINCTEIKVDEDKS